MKTRLFFAICLFLAVFTAKGQPTTPADLKLGDWLELEYVDTQRDSTPDNIWRAEDIMKIRFRGTVVRKTKEDLTFSFKPIHFYWHNSSDKDTYSYYDSHINGDYYNTQIYGKNDSFKNDSLMFSIQLPENIPQDTIWFLQRNFWNFTSPIMHHGLRKNSRGGTHQYSISTIKEIFRDAMLGYFYQWKNHQDMPEIITLNGDIHGYVRLVETSSGMKPNVHLICKTGENSLSFTISGHKYTFSQKEGKQECRFYLSSPAKTIFNEIPLWLTPGDSIVIEKDNANEYRFSGKGAANFKFAQDEQKLLQQYRNMYYKELETRIEKMSEIYHSLWKKYGKQMEPYWLKSSQLSYKYWYMTPYFELERSDFGEFDFQIPWDNPQFTDVEPYTDYLYQPEHYERFMNVFYRYKLSQLSNDNLTGFVENITTDWLKSEYYIKKTLFFGYPRLLLMKNTLGYFMQQNHYATYRIEYDDFMQICHEPNLRREISDLHQKLMKIEPGRKIQDVIPELDLLPFLKDKADGYMMLSLKNQGLGMDLSWTKDIWSILEEAGLSDQMIIIALRSEEYTKSLSVNLKNPNNYLYLTNEITGDLLSLLYVNYILFRNDGTIVSHYTFANFHNLPDLIRADIAERDRKPEKSRKALLQIILISCLVSLVTAFVAGIYIKIVKMREYNKRKISELELKAIRSQMNPHFVFNALGSIQSLINQEKTADANHYLVNFARLLRMALSSADKKLTPLADELEQLELYLQLEQLRVPFAYRISLADDVNPANEEIPGMLIQPIVENAVIHGIVPQQGGQIDICIRREENILLVEVVDDGAGFADNALQKNGFGIRAINERLALLNNELKTNISLKFENRQAKEGVSGTRVTIFIEN